MKTKRGDKGKKKRKWVCTRKRVEGEEWKSKVQVNTKERKGKKNVGKIMEKLKIKG